MLLAMKKQKQQIEYETDKEITPAEQVHMKTKQYEKIKQQIKKDEQSLKTIKSVVLGGKKQQITQIDQLANS